MRRHSADSVPALHLLDHAAVMRYYLMIMTRTKEAPLLAPLKVCSIKLPPATADMLNDLSQDATDALGRPVSSSALVRALLVYLAEQTPAWISTTLYPHIEQEIVRGLVWGKKQQ